ncbi:TetR/AcrR family transcriptional regulator [Chryseobacterium sp.]|uniref:TetR/AcrR family transcriptional regulator n=1 Tax=Chryseobacterium sp. TaxID=1871047 RepID=UPI00289770AE|nr:TetR/AcrR family transcriptional regulator [Chryseobacterium sp.]
MERKSSAGSIRNKERSKKRFLDAVGKILKTKGFTGLKVNDIAAKAGVDKKMIYMYFGGMDGLIDEYISSQDFWSKVTPEEFEKYKPQIVHEGQLFTVNMLFSQLDYLYNNKEAQKLLVWGLSEPRKSLKKLSDIREENGERIFRLLKDTFGERLDDFRAVMAIMISGMYYLNLYASMNGSIFCGLDLNTPEGREHIKRATSFLVKQSYENL